MSRPVRIELPGGAYHVTSKGRQTHQPGTASAKSTKSIDTTNLTHNTAQQAQPIFRDQEDYAVFLNILDNVVARFGWLLHSYVLLADHYQLVIEVPGTNLSKGMRQLNGVYTQHVNRRYRQQGSIFQGRFKSVLFEKQKYLLPLCRHVVTNPAPFASWPWSSYQATAGQVQGPAFLHTADLLGEFGKREKSSQRKYRDYVHAGVGAASPLEQRTRQVLLGSAAFVRQMQPLLLGETGKKPPKAVRRRKSLTTIFRRLDGKSRAERNLLIRHAHQECNYTLTEIGQHLGLHHTTVSRAVKAG